MKMPSKVYRKFIWSGAILLAILAIGTVGYWLIGGRHYSLVDTLYMTMITITTIGFGEIVDLSGSPTGRIFTIFIAITGIGVLAYVLTNLTALVVEGELTESFRRRKMEKMANRYQDHYVVCGIGSVGFHIVSELHATRRAYVMVDVDKRNATRALELFPDGVFIEGDATDNTTLLKTGIDKAKGLFAATADDDRNLIISLTAKQLNPNLKVVARCNETGKIEKIKKAGADAVISPSSIGGLRMASEMMRPTVVSFLDVMLRDKEKNLRVEEVPIPLPSVGKTLSALNLKRFHKTLLLAVKEKENWVYHPSESHVIQSDSTLVVMTVPEERRQMEESLHINA